MKHTDLKEIRSLSESFFNFHLAISTLGEPSKKIGSNYVFQGIHDKFEAVKLIVHNDLVDHVSATLHEPVGLSQIEQEFKQPYTLIEDFRSQLRYAQFRSGEFLFRFIIPNDHSIETLSRIITEFEVTRTDLAPQT